MRRVPALVAALFLASLSACGSDDGGVAISVAGPGGANGSGMVGGPNGLISCHITTRGASGNCSATVEPGTDILLTATADDGSLFMGWSGPCSGTGTCSFTASTTAEIRAQFTRNIGIIVTESPGATGSVQVTSSPAGISCWVTNGEPLGDCSALFPEGTNVTLSAPVNADNLFDGWSGDCSGASCSIVIGTLHRIAPRTRSNYLLTVAPEGGGTGKGTIRSTPAGILCNLEGTTTSGTCSMRFPGALSAGLEMIPGADTRFSGWDIADCGTLTTCYVPLTPTTLVHAHLAYLASLTVVTSPGSVGTATITSIDRDDDEVFTCTIGAGATTPCTTRFPVGTQVTLSASAWAGTQVAGWGACIGTWTCVVEVSQNTAIPVWLQPWKALRFDGTSQFATIQPVPAFDNAIAWIVDAKVRIATPSTGKQVIFSRWTGTGAALALLLNEGRLRLEIGDGTGESQALEAQGANSVIPTGSWVHVVAAYDGATARLYRILDDPYDPELILLAEGPLERPARPSALLSIGRRGPTGPGQYFNGEIDEVRVWRAGVVNLPSFALNRAPQEGLVGYWRFDEPDGQHLMDLSYAEGVSHDGVLGAMDAVEAVDPVRVDVSEAHSAVRQAPRVELRAPTKRTAAAANRGTAR